MPSDRRKTNRVGPQEVRELLSNAVALHQAGELGRAETIYRDVLAAADKNSVEVHLLALQQLGVLLHHQKRYDAALEQFEKAIRLQPDSADAHNNKGIILRTMQRYDAALASFEKAISLKPDNAEAYNNKGVVLQEMQRSAEALASFEAATAHKENYAEAYKNKGSILAKMRRYDEALVSYGKAIAIKPDYAEAHHQRGVILYKMERTEEALQSYDTAIALMPGNAEAHTNRGVALQAMQRYAEAMASYEQALLLAPDMPYLAGSLLQVKMLVSDWLGVGALFDRVIAGVEAGKPSVTPFALVGTAATLAQLKKCAESCARIHFPPSAKPLWNGERYTHDRIRIGYFSADFHNHAVMVLMAQLFEMHDRARFEVTAFSFGPPVQDEMRQRLEKAFEHFIDVRERSESEIAALARGMEIDIAVDLLGYTQRARTEMFAARLAPVQAMYLGYPGTMGAEYMDYLIADSVLIPPQDKPHYTEKIITMPHSYQVNDASRVIPDKNWTRREMGLPEEGVVFCCFNNSYKITPEAFDVWMRLLRRVPGSVLWLFEANPLSAQNLQKEAQARGIDKNRIVFARHMELADHFARHRLADLFLDNFNYNAHATASHALWAGLPVLTCRGTTFASRVGASLLQALGLPELITQSHAEYETLAFELATDPQKLAAIRAKLARNKTTHPLFDTALFTRHLEQAYTTMHEIAQAGMPPQDIDVQNL